MIVNLNVIKSSLVDNTPALTFIEITRAAGNLLFTQPPVNKLLALQRLTASDCNLTQLAQLGVDFTLLISLVEIDLSHNRLTSICKSDFNSVSNLQILRLAHNNISFIDIRSFSSLKILHVLDLRSNAILDLESSTMYSAISLLLSGNRFTSFDNVTVYEASSVLKCSLKLALDANNINHFPVSVLRSNLVFSLIDLSSNRIDALLAYSSLIGEKTTVRCSLLDLRNNGLKRIEENSVLDIFKFLTDLDLSDNRLAELGNFTFTQQTMLSRLNLSGNVLQTIGRDLFRFNQKLEWLDLSGNRIRLVEEFTFDKFTSLKYIYLGGNEMNMRIGKQLRNGSQQGLPKLTMVSVPPKMFYQNETQLPILMEMFKAKLYKEMLGKKILYSNRIVYSPNEGDYTSKDCGLILQAIKLNVQLNLETDNDFNGFLKMCKFYIDKSSRNTK